LEQRDGVLNLKHERFSLGIGRPAAVIRLMEFIMRWFKVVIAGLLLVAAFMVIFGIPANFVAEMAKSQVAAQTGYHLHFRPTAQSSMDGGTILTAETSLTNLSAHFDLANAVATTDNLTLIGPVPCG
jgi:hypothetical protein